jgi:2-keto-4-pentenoate hydratase/2-oxohepta-3-ene-1,7-dioic acid hydratase in catechol pathway
MKIGRFADINGNEATGVLVKKDGTEKVLNLSKADVALNSGALGTLDDIIVAGRKKLGNVAKVVDKATSNGEAGWFGDVKTTKWLVPNRPVQCLCAGRNFGRHMAEMNKQVWESKLGGASEKRAIPTGFVKLTATLVEHEAKVARPIDVTNLDYEVEPAAIISERLERVSEERGLDAVFGYTVFNDLSAREWQFTEMESRTIIVGKNFPGAGPIGPWILTADEVPDPAKLELSLRVNGTIRQSSTCEDMIFPMATLIAFWSRVGLLPGDVICGGTPSGVAMAHKPDPNEWYLRPGDVVEAEIKQIGLLRTHIV